MIFYIINFVRTYLGKVETKSLWTINKSRMHTHMTKLYGCKSKSQDTVTITRASNARYLELSVDSNLKWNHHANLFKKDYEDYVFKQIREYFPIKILKLFITIKLWNTCMGFCITFYCKQNKQEVTHILFCNELMQIFYMLFAGWATWKRPRNISKKP